MAKIKPKPVPPRDQAYKGQLSRTVLAALRQSDTSLTTKELARHVMAERGLKTAGIGLVRIMGERVGACLRHYRDKGLARSEMGEIGFWFGRMCIKPLIRAETTPGSQNVLVARSKCSRDTLPLAGPLGGNTCRHALASTR